MKSTYTITTPLYYVNDKPHLGSSYTTIACDALARFHRLEGKDVLFITGVDEHGQKIQRTAESKNVDPQIHCDEISEKYRKLWDKLNISYDRFIRTTSKIHESIVHEFYKKVLDSDDIINGRQQGWYCVGCEEYKEVSSNNSEPECDIHAKKLEWRDEENIFFRLSKYQKEIEELINKPGFVSPPSRKNEITQFVANGLKDFSISRKNLSWGIPVPNKPDHTFYVWFDALLGYISGSVGDTSNIGLSLESQKYWPANVHVIGKDILRFHAVYWPAMLLSAGIDIPKKVLGHGFLTREGRKMGKSLGNVLDPESLVAFAGIDGMRWYLLRDIHFGEDGDFQIKRFVDIINNDLSNTVGNLLNRSLIMYSKWYKDELPIENKNGKYENQLSNIIFKKVSQYKESFNNLNFKLSAEAILELANSSNLYLNDNEPWKLIKDNQNKKEVALIIYSVLDSCRVIANMLYPIIPNMSIRMLDQLNLQIDPNDWTQGLDPGILPNKGYTDKPKPVLLRLDYPDNL